MESHRFTKELREFINRLISEADGIRRNHPTTSDDSQIRETKWILDAYTGLKARDTETAVYFGHPDLAWSFDDRLHRLRTMARLN